jgi:hypothetical protein
MSELLADTAAARKRRKAIALILAAVTLVLLIIAILWWRSLGSESEPAISNPATPVRMSAVDVFAVYENDPTLAQLDNRPILITAKLAAPPTTGTVILLSTPGPLLSLGAEMAPGDAVRLSGAKAGTELSLECEGVNPGLRAPILKNCSIQ